MATTNSLIGYATATLTIPTPGASLIGYTSATLTNPGPSKGPSAIGYASGVLVGPANSGPSPIGFVSKPIGFIHRPIAVFNADGSLTYVPLRTWDGTTLK